MAETKGKATPGQLIVHHRSYRDICICPKNQTETVTIATMGIWSDQHRAELLAYADLFAAAPETARQRDELLRVCQKVVAAERVGEILSIIDDDISAAIAKAEPS